MIEKLKTGVLTVLVLLSLLQSALLSYSSPNPDQQAVQDKYVKTDILGTQASLEEMLFPDHIVVHLGNEHHTVFYPMNKTYTEILDTVKQRYLEGFRRNSLTTLSINWDEVRTKRPGVEIRFRDGLPMNVLQRLLQVKGDLPVENDVITRIWIFAETEKKVRTILFTDTSNVIYEAVNADFTTKDIEERFVGVVGAGYTPYKPISNDIYLPQKNLPIPGYSMNYTLLTVDQLKRTFFVDPAVTRNLKERDGSEIYTDSKRGLQLKSEQHWMTYSDPVAPAADNRIDYPGSLLTAVQFINQHGGWNGTYALQKVPERLLPGSQAFVFRQYYGPYPLINLRNENTGFMKITLQKDFVSGYERSIITPDARSTEHREMELPGGEALDAKLEAYKKKTQMVDVFPAYRPMVTDKSLELVPMWAVELIDGTYEFLE